MPRSAKFYPVDNPGTLIHNLGMRLKKVRLLVAMTLLWSVSPILPATVPHFRNISINDGLSQNSVNVILQDRKGFVWIATQDGLNRFDGYNFRIFKTDPTDPSGLSDNYISAMIQDCRGHIWLGTEDGVNEYDPQTERFVRISLPGSGGDGPVQDHVTALFEAPSQPGIIWIGSERGLERYDIAAGRFTSFRHRPQDGHSLPHDYIQCLYEAPSRPGSLWIGTRNGLASLNLANGHIVRLPLAGEQANGLCHPDVRTLYEAPSVPGTVWVGTAAGLDRLDIARESFSHVTDNGLQGAQVRALLEPTMAPHTLWIGVWGGGIILYSLDREEIQEHFLAGPDQQSLSDNFILHFFEDRSHLLWIGTQGGGLCQYSQQTRNFLLYLADPHNDNSLSHRTVRAVSESRSRPGQVWIGTFGGLDLLDRKSGRISHFRHRSDPDDGPPSNLIRAVLEDSQGRLWVGTHDAGLANLDLNSGKWIRFRHSFGRTNTIRCLFEDRTGVIWIGTLGAGLSRFDEPSGDFITYSYQDGVKDGISSERVYAVIEDRAGRLWIGTSDGLNRLDRASGRFFAYFNDPHNPVSLSHNLVMSLYQDSRGFLWVGTWGGGVNRYDEARDRFDRFTELEGLANNVVYGILEDGQGKLWFSTNNGLSRFDPLTLQFRNYDVTDGLQSNEFNANAHHRGLDGMLYFGGINGLTAFFPASIRENPYQPPLVISDFQIANRSVPIGSADSGNGLLRKSIAYTDSLNLSYRDQIISFEYSALSFAAPEKNRYAYMMEGLEEDWNYVGSRRFVTYTNVPPGNYRFRVKGANHDGFWNEIGTFVDLTITPPFWRTVWFQILFALLMILLLQMLLSLRTRTLQRRKTILEHVVKARTQELTQQNEDLARLSLVAKHTDNGVLIMDDQGDVEWINEGFTRMYGYSYEQLLAERGRNMATVSHRDDFPLIFRKCVDSRQPVVYENQCLTRSGQERWSQTVLNPILDDQGRVVKLVLIDSDITLLKKANERAERERAAAEEANQAKSSFLARMSHEIRTPMNGVIGFTDMLLETPLTPEQRDYLHTIKSSGESLLYLINDILDFSRIEAGNMAFERVDFNFEQLICESCEIVAPRAEFKEVELVCRIADDVPAYICSDPMRLRQVMINLLDNALKFTERGLVELSVGSRSEDGNRYQLDIKVRDTGPGIPMEKQKTIFNAFTQADESISRRHGGTGLGLAICHQIALQMGGEITLVSEPGQGSTFTFRIPVDRSAREPSPAIPEGALTGKRVLIVDDNSNNLAVLDHILRSHGMLTRAIDDPFQVIPELERSRSAQAYDLCIIDILMPMTDGFVLARKIRQLPPPLADIPLLAYSSSITSQISQYRNAGFNAFLTKPIQKRKLLRTVWSLIERDAQPLETPPPYILAVDKRQARLQVLLAEDNVINRKLIDRLLGKAGHSLTSVDNGLQAIEEIEKNPQRYDIIFMDIHMPVLDGLQATRRIRERGYTKIPIIALTADSMKGDREKCLEAGMNDYISKPINREDLLRIMLKWSR